MRNILRPEYIAYFDNAATSYPKPPSVMTAFRKCARYAGGNPGRSSHDLAQNAAEEVYRARESVCTLLHTDRPENVIFTLNATYALNMAIKSAAKKCGPCHILLSDTEHNAVVRPVVAVCESDGYSYSTFRTDADAENTEKNILAALRPNTKILVCTLASNVTGDEIPIEVLSRVRKTCGIIVIADASQALGHIDIDFEKTPVDVLCAPGHKGLFGMQGCGFAVFDSSAGWPTLIEGGSGNESRSPTMPEAFPERMEAGTLPTPTLASLAAGIAFVRDTFGIAKAAGYVAGLTEEISKGLEKTNGIRKIGTAGHGILSFVSDTYPSERYAALLNDAGICVRGGLHCAPSVHEKYKTAEVGAVRVSLSVYNSHAQVDHFLRTVSRLQKI